MNRVLPDDVFAAQTRAFAERLAHGPTLAYAAGKRIVRLFRGRDTYGRQGRG